MFYNQLIKLCKERGVKPTPVIRSLGYSATNLKRWKEGATVNSNILSKIAEYFDVPVGYFFEEDDKKLSEIIDNRRLTLGERICEVRNHLEFSQKQFSDFLGIPQSTLSAYETDRMQPTLTAIINIALKCGVSIDWLCGIEKDKCNKSDDSSVNANNTTFTTIRSDKNGNEIKIDLTIHICSEDEAEADDDYSILSEYVDEYSPTPSETVFAGDVDIPDF